MHPAVSRILLIILVVALGVVPMFAASDWSRESAQEYGNGCHPPVPSTFPPR